MTLHSGYMPIILKRAARLFANCALVCMSLYLSEAAASPVQTEDAVRTQDILNSIAEVENSNSRSMRLEKSHDLAEVVYKTVQSSHISAIDENVIRRLGDLMEVPDGRFWTALAIAQLGTRASSLAPKLIAALEDEHRRMEERKKVDEFIMAQGDDPKEGICVALKKIGADAPKSCSED